MFLKPIYIFIVSTKGCVRSITKYHILQHELTTAMQYHPKQKSKVVVTLYLFWIPYIGKITRGLSN